MTNLSSESLNKFAASLFLPLKNGECVSCMFVAGGGKRTIIKHLLNEKKILKNIFGETFAKTLFVYVDPDEIMELSNKDYLELIASSLKKEIKSKGISPIKQVPDNKLSEIKDILSAFVDSGLRVIFILNNFETTLSLSPSIFLNLETIMSIDKSKIVYLFLSTVNLFDEEVIKNLHNLKYAVSRKIRYFPLFSKKESQLLIDQTAKKIKINISDKLRNVVFDICGGHPQLIKYALHILAEKDNELINNPQKAKDYLLNHYQIKLVCADIWNFLSQKEKEIINNLVITGKLSSSQQDEADYLLNLGLIEKRTDNYYRVFGSAFEAFIKNKLPVQKLVFDSETKKLFYGIKSCEDKFTFQEFKLVSHFITHENELITRDQVAEVMWGRLFLEKYSDWSIDKTISTIRKKLDALGFPSHYLVTLKKRGFSFSNPL